MPLYEYVCKKCEKKFEVMVKLAEADKKIPCPYCKKPLNKQLTAVSFRME